MLRADIVRKWLREEEEEVEDSSDGYDPPLACSCSCWHSTRAVLMRATIEQLVAACAEAAGATLVRSIMKPRCRCSLTRVGLGLADLLPWRSLVAAVHSSMAVNQVRLHEGTVRSIQHVHDAEKKQKVDLNAIARMHGLDAVSLCTP